MALSDDSAVDLPADDLGAAPWRYPGTPPVRSGLVQDGRLRRLPSDRWLDGRHAVVAVGSNASPGVVHRKLERGRVSTTFPMLLGRVQGVRAGHSAHVSLPGYVAATAVLDERAEEAVVVTLLDDVQLRCLDATEPNYVRETVTGRRLLLDAGPRTESFEVYVSRWGALAPPGREPLPRTAQDDLYAMLDAQVPGFSDLHGRSSPRTAMALFASDPALREAAKEAFATTGWARGGALRS